MIGSYGRTDITVHCSVSERFTPTSSCASATPSALPKPWVGAAGCRDAFEALSSAIVDRLITANEEDVERSCTRFT